MSEQQYYEVHARICKTLAHPSRLMLINALRDGEKNVNELAQELGIPQGTISRHLNYMRQWGVVLARREGQNVYYRLGSPKIITAYRIMHEFAMEYLEGRVELMRMVNV